MESFRPASTEQVNVFEIGDRYLFKYYFEESAVFDRLKSYYNNTQYRFEVPPGEFQTIRSFLAGYGYGLVVVEAIAEFVVVVQQYSAHPENIFKESVIQRGHNGYNYFVMTDQAAVSAAIKAGAQPLIATELENPFE